MIKNKVYIIPAWGSVCTERPYILLSRALKAKGYNPIPINPNWYHLLTRQVFRPEPDSIIIGHSFGAVLAYLIARKYPLKKVILASLSPVKKLSYNNLYKEAVKHMSPNMATAIISDIKSIKIDRKKMICPHILFAGDREKDILSDIKVKNTGHFLTSTYIKAIVRKL